PGLRCCDGRREFTRSAQVRLLSLRDRPESRALRVLGSPPSRRVAAIRSVTDLRVPYHGDDCMVWGEPENTGRSAEAVADCLRCHISAWTLLVSHPARLRSPACFCGQFPYGTP